MFNLDPIFGEILNKIYLPDFDFNGTVEHLEENYNLSYTQKLEEINKKERQKRKQKQPAEIQPKIQKTQKKEAKNVKKTEKNVEKVKKEPVLTEKPKTAKLTKTRVK